MRKYTLPALPYAHDALEPAIDAETMRLHHDIHHKGYVDGANRALAGLAEARKTGDAGQIKALSRDLAFNVSGHALHSVFWSTMGPADAHQDPRPDLLRRIEADFGSFDAFRQHFSAAATGVEGSGWAVLAWEPVAEGLMVLQIEKHQNLTAQGLTPLLALDVWEHAYYLKYQNRRAQYVEAWWSVVNWSDVAERLEHAMGAAVGAGR